MAMTSEQYKQAGLQLLPQGRAWDKSEDGGLSQILGSAAQMLARIDSIAETITNEAIPANALVLLSDYEEFAGLPDCTVDEAASTNTKRNALVKKLKMSGTLSKAHLIELAAEGGYTIKIIERHPHHCLRDINYPLHPWRNWWLAFIYVVDAQIRYATVLDNITTTLTIRDDFSDLICLLERYKPAHINLIYIDEV